VLPTDLGTYGGPYVDAKVVTNPESQLAASKANRALEDTAQLTHTGLRAIAHVRINAGTPTIVYHTSVWGSSDAEKPTPTLTGTGLLTLTYGTEFTDGVGYEETVSFLSGMAHVISTSDYTAKVSSLAANVVTARLRDNTGALSNLTNSDIIVVWLR
jgi:hypothetical protein